MLKRVNRCLTSDEILQQTGRQTNRQTSVCVCVGGGARKRARERGGIKEKRKQHASLEYNVTYLGLTDLKVVYNTRYHNNMMSAGSIYKIMTNARRKTSSHIVIPAHFPSFLFFGHE